MQKDGSPLNLIYWIRERYPAPVMVYAGVVYLLCSAIANRLLGQPVPFNTVHTAVGIGVAISTFLLIRTLDEHKDYAADCIVHPYRVLQRGLVTLTHLKVVAIGCIALQLGASVYLDRGIGPVTTAWLAFAGWLILMTKEFFVSAWLKKQLFLYSVSHMVIMGFIAAWLTQFAVPGGQLLGQIWPLYGLVFLSGFAGEIVRKTWGPEEERDGVDSYAKQFGLKGASGLVIGLVIVAAWVLIMMIQTWAPESAWVYGMLGVGVAASIPIMTLVQFCYSPDQKGRKRNELAIGLFMLLGYLAVIISLGQA